MAFQFVNVNAFTPNLEGWTSIGPISSFSQTGNTFLLVLANDNRLRIQLTFLSDSTFRVRFNPQPNFDYSVETSVAVVNRQLGPVNLTVTQSNPQLLVVHTGVLSVQISLQDYQIQVFRNGQLINQDVPGKNLVYIPGQEVVANFKVYPANAKYCGFGEKAGSSFLKNNFTMTFFNFDNFKYSSGIIPAGNEGGPLNPSEPLYTSVPLLIEVNPAPQNQFAGNPYAYGLFFDNPAQSYFNVGASDYSNMFGKYYFGALYGDMDYYFMYGPDATGVLNHYTTLTGRSPMPPKYTFGYHQGGYGYYNSYLLSVVANSYRAARIPIDGLHIDVDFQNNYRTFTSSELKFPNVSEYMKYLHSIGFKCSTNITPLLTNNDLDENANKVDFTQRTNLQTINGLLFNTHAGQGPNPNLYEGTVSYGVNRNFNPYPVPPIQPNRDGSTPLGASGNYPDFGRTDVRRTWGDQYQHLLNEVDMDMIWQDMTDPAIKNAPVNTFPLDLQQSLEQTQAGNTTISFVPHAKIHNLYALNLVKASSEGIQRLRPQKRTFIIARGGYAGVQRYAGLWTGDSASSWDFLRINLPQVLNMGMSGIPISGSDIGGFATGADSEPNDNSSIFDNKVFGAITNYELFTRWMQLGSFLPWYRNHYDGYNKQFQEVYAYGEPVPTNCRKYIELRYRMLQLYYDAMFEWTQTGTPIARPLFLTDGNDPNVYDHLDDQFMVGKDVLVAPMLNPFETLNPPQTPQRNVYLPAGSQWYAFMDNCFPLSNPVAGGTLVQNYVAGLDLVPIYIRAGAILPMRELEQYVGELAVNPLTINIYPGLAGTYTLYQDDGITTNAALHSQFRTTQISHTQQNNTTVVNLNRTADNYTPAEPSFFVALLGTQPPTFVSVNGAPLPNAFTPDALAASPVSSYYWNQNLATTFIIVFDTNASLTITATF